MLAPVGLLPLLLANVAKVDLRATGTPSEMQQTVLKGVLTATYAGAGLTVTADDMTVHTGTPGSTVIEVSGTSHTLEQIDGYWCLNDPALRNNFKDLAWMNTGLSDITDVRTCLGESGEGCESSTPCGDGGGSGGDGGAEEPEPEPAPEPDGNGSGEDDDGDSISTAGVVLIVIGTLACVAVLLYIFWPSLATLCVPPPASPMVSSVPMTDAVRTPRTGAAPFLGNDAL